MIEKRYRTNLNDKIAALRDSVPSLRVMAGTSKLGEDDEEEDLEGLAPAHKLNKATVLAKATEYIRHLEKRTKRLQDENEQLKNRLAAFEKLAMGGPMQNNRPGATGGPGGGLMSRLMVGSLAGLMVAGGLSAHEDASSSRQLFALPVTFLELLGVPASPSVMAGTHAFWLVFKAVLLVAAVVYIILPSWFNAKPPPLLTSKPLANAPLSAAPSLASPLDVRRKAWLTAIQTVWVPRHTVAAECAALSLKAIKLALMKTVGWQRYRTLTGMTDDAEAARIKAWTIAIDAQLAGGDAELSPARLVLTWMASLTLPATPARLMLNALHLRVLFSVFPRWQPLATRMAAHYWQAAAEKNAAVAAEDKLPEHLTALLALPHDAVFVPDVVAQAHALAYTAMSDERDVSIRSPLDALASWYSALLLSSALASSLRQRVPSPSAATKDSAQSRINTTLSTALSVAPSSSAAHLRALSAKAVLAADDAALHRALQIYREDFAATEAAAARRGRSPPVACSLIVSTDIRVALRCAMVRALLAQGKRAESLRLFADLDWRRLQKELGLLGFVSTWRTLNAFVNRSRVPPPSSTTTSTTTAAATTAAAAAEGEEAIEAAAAMLRLWIGNGKTARARGIAIDECRRVVEFCLDVQNRLAGFSRRDEDDAAADDDGYVSGGGGGGAAVKALANNNNSEVAAADVGMIPEIRRVKVL